MAVDGQDPGAGSHDRTRQWPPVSVIMPVLNEEAHLAAAVGRVLAQDYPGELEIVLAVGPSRDRTERLAAELAADDPRVRVVPNPSGRTPAALNAAIGASSHPVVARVDGHALMPADYLRVAVRTLRETGADNVGGIMAAEGVTPFQQAVARAMTSPVGVGSARFHTGGEPGAVDTVYLGVFRRAALERVGGYDEAFLRAQDWEMNHRIRAGGGTVWFQPKMRVTYRPRPTVRALARQYFHYGRWRRVVARQHKGTINPRYLAPPLLVLALLAGTLAGAAGLAAGWWPALLGFAAPAGYLLAVLAASAAVGRGLKGTARLWLPVAVVTMHLSWGTGFLTSPPGLGADSRIARGAAGGGTDQAGTGRANAASA
ncbi:glycosyltransferase family 2 protein [Allonocardiopsis opalescens]|uniref:Cellulose synthase/poly-beta-1,6-N-acetylglucosamine synthase-like glycosyltransferase n=1 Tax=Allonocardiopsis opalescens TaxID=1144618 RepID=A0A2T0QC22_9ACTN|nr:glycosyltransferase family 2 protein [Allonocardiopsis opalescens]PRY01455.1 cellulose synthase/poly-beta-1,6-N-acetylglucosamine synthase-like glycosyltransferase [Allonocardiopsis opalescens]